MERGDTAMEEEAAVNYSLAGRAREYVRDFTNIEAIVEWMDFVFEKVRQTIDHANKSNASYKEMIRRGEHLVATHNNLKRQVDAAPFKAIIYQPKIWITTMQLLDFKRELSGVKYKSIPSEDQNPPYYLWRYAFYLLLFPPRYQVPARRLIALWIAEGLVHPTQGEDKSVEQIAADYLDQLRTCGLIRVVEENELMNEANRGILTCSIEESMRGKLMKEANRAEFLTRRLVDCSDYNYNHTCRSYIKIQGNRTTPESLRNPRDVISFLSFNTREGSKPGEDIGDFLQRCISSGCFGSIKVLDLERVFRPKLPDTLGRLITLKYLGLRWTYLQQLPDSVEELINLQVLDLKKTYISVLPRSIWRMQFLTHLYLSEAYRTRFPQKPSSQITLSALQTLWGAFIDEDTPVQGGLDQLKNVRNLGLSCKPKESIAEEMQGQPGAANTTKPMEQQLAVIDRWISKLDHLESLRLKSRDEYNKAASLSLTSLENKDKLSTLYLLGKLNKALIMHLPASLTKITLSGSDLQENPLYFLGKLPNLKMLRLLGQSVGCTQMHCIKQAFPQLKLLWIWKLENLEDLKVEEGSMSCLKELEIRNCQRLKALPSPLLYIQNLEIKLTDMPQRIAEDAKNINPFVKIIQENPTQ